MISIPGRIPIRIYPMFFLVTGVIGWLNSGDATLTLIWMAVIFFSVLLHEMGHALTALAFGQESTVSFVAMGGVTHRKGPKLSLPKEFLVVLNGPFFGISFALFLMALGGRLGEPTGLLGNAYRIALSVNVIWSLLNLLPVGPLDGAVLMNIALEGTFGVKGIKLGYILSLTCGLLFGALSIAGQQPLLGAIFFMLSFESFRAYIATRPMTREDRDDDLQTLFQRAQELHDRNQTNEALALFQDLRQKAGSGLLYIAATEKIAQISSERGEHEEAFQLLNPIRQRLSKEALRLFHRTAYYNRDAEAVTTVGDRCFQEDQSHETAFINALCYALLERPNQAVGWLEAAKQKGMPQLVENLQKREFDAIRDNELFQGFLYKLGD